MCGRDPTRHSGRSAMKLPTMSFSVFFSMLVIGRNYWGFLSYAAFIGPLILLLAPVWFLGVAAWHCYKRVQVAMVLGTCLFVFSLALYVVFVASGARNYFNSLDQTRTLSDYVIGSVFAAHLLSVSKELRLSSGLCFLYFRKAFG